MSTAVFPPPRRILYLHGFRSSPQSFKARRVAAWLSEQRPDVHWWCPQLPPGPADAWSLIREGAEPHAEEPMAVIGSSLGGFYATAVAEAFGCPAALLNPAIDPARDLAREIGEQTFFHMPEQRFLFKPEYVDELRALTVPAITRPERYFALICKGDEVLDWREMAARYPGASLQVLEGGDHAISDFDRHLPQVLRFLRLA